VPALAWALTNIGENIFAANPTQQIRAGLRLPLMT